MLDTYAILDCEDAEKWADYSSSLWYSVVNGEENAKVYKVCSGELPSEEDLEVLKGIVITGSHYSVNCGEEWVSKLLSFIRNFANRTKTGGYGKNNNIPKLIGSCFGCQAIAKALGGEVIQNKCSFFVFNYENIQLSPQLENFAFGSVFYNRHMTNGCSSFTVLESHSECVTKVPDDAIVLGTSSTAPNELFLVNNNILAIQSHPEISPSLALEKIYPALKSNGRLVKEEEVLNNFQQPNDHPSVLSFLSEFLRS